MKAVINKDGSLGNNSTIMVAAASTRSPTPPSHLPPFNGSAKESKRTREKLKRRCETQTTHVQRRRTRLISFKSCKQRGKREDVDAKSQCWHINLVQMGGWVGRSALRPTRTIHSGMGFGSPYCLSGEKTTISKGNEHHSAFALPPSCLVLQSRTPEEENITRAKHNTHSQLLDL